MMTRPRHGRPGPGALRAGRATAAVMAAAALVVTAGPAGAHPFVADGGRVPVESLITIELDLAHGCGEEAAGRGAVTDEVALEVPDWLRIVDVPLPTGWSVTREAAAPPATAAVVWTATTAAEPAPRFALDVVVAGEAGTTRHLRVSQRCGDALLRWSGTPDAPAELPAVRLRLLPPDPDRPPPPPDGTGVEDRGPGPAPVPPPPPAPQATVPEAAAPEAPEAAGPAVPSTAAPGVPAGIAAGVAGATVAALALVRSRRRSG